MPVAAVVPGDDRPASQVIGREQAVSPVTVVVVGAALANAQDFPSTIPDWSPLLCFLCGAEPEGS